jgi:hypothetical protein
MASARFVLVHTLLLTGLSFRSSIAGLSLRKPVIGRVSGLERGSVDREASSASCPRDTGAPVSHYDVNGLLSSES